MIISLRGTNGAGKSTIVREVMKDYTLRSPLMVTGRMKPLGYHLYDRGRPDLFVPGHYEIANGGIDTIRDLDSAYELIAEQSRRKHVLYEGRNLTDKTQRVLRFQPSEISIIVLKYPVDLCIQAVRQRGHRIKEQTIQRIDRMVSLDADSFEKLGYTVYRTEQREMALIKCRELLREHQHNRVELG